MQERRNHSRLESDWSADVCHLGNSFIAHVNNISLGGVELKRPVAWHPVVNEICQVSFQLTRAQILSVDMQVCWVADTHIGMQFEKLAYHQKKLLNMILSNLSRRLTLAESHFVM